MFLRDLWRFVIFFWLLEIVTGSSDIVPEIYVRNWFTFLNEQNLLLDFEGTRFVNERSLFWKKKKKIPLPTDP
jgi:hypothetical protein